MVYQDLMQNALIVPLKVLRHEEGMKSGYGVLQLAWHPTQPWLFASCANGDVLMYTE
jgi:ribosome biogenesis protein ERB1